MLLKKALHNNGNCIPLKVGIVNSDFLCPTQHNRQNNKNAKACKIVKGALFCSHPVVADNKA